MNLTAAVEEEIWPPPALQNGRRAETSSPALQLPRCSRRVSTSAIATKLSYFNFSLSPLPPTHHLLNPLTIYFLPVTTVLGVTSYTHAFFTPVILSLKLLLRLCPGGNFLFTTPNIAFSVTCLNCKPPGWCHQP